MSMIENIREKIEIDLFEFSKHAVDQSIIRNISVQDVRTVIANGTIIENYPEDKYGSSCLIFGMTAERRPIHIQCSYPSRPIIDGLVKSLLGLSFRVKREIFKT